MLLDVELRAAIKHSKFSYVWSLELGGSNSPQMSLPLLFRQTDANIFGKLTRLGYVSLC